jgi:hypothetical protein
MVVPYRVSGKSGGPDRKSEGPGGFGPVAARSVCSWSRRRILCFAQTLRWRGCDGAFALRTRCTDAAWGSFPGWAECEPGIRPQNQVPNQPGWRELGNCTGGNGRGTEGRFLPGEERRSDFAIEVWPETELSAPGENKTPALLIPRQQAQRPVCGRPFRRGLRLPGRLGSD